MRGHRILIRVVAPAAAVALLAAACGSSKPSSSSTSTTGGSTSGSAVKIGFFGALTGPNAQLGINIDNGVKLAVDQYNAKGQGPKVTLVPYDSQGDPAQAPQLAQKAISDHTVAIVGPAFSGESKAADPIFEQAQIVNVSPSATAVSLAQNGWKYFHRIVANDDAQGPAASDFIAKKLNAKKVAVIDDASEYGKGLADTVASSLTKAGVTVADRESTDPKATDYSATVNKVKAANVDAVYYGGYYSAAALLAKQLHDAGVKASFISDDGTLDQKFVEGAGAAAAEGAYATCACGDVSNTDPTFVSQYQKAFNTAPGTYSAEGYDAANVILQAIGAGKTTGPAINDYLSTINYTGITKTIKFDSKGEVVGNAIYAYQVKNGKFTNLGLISKLIGG